MQPTFTCRFQSYISIHFSGLAALMSADIARNLWSLVCSCLNSYCTFFIFSHFDFFLKYVAFCTAFNLLTPIFCYPILYWISLYLHLTSKVPSTQIRFHVVFIEKANFSLRFHLASTRKRSKTMIVFTENDNFWKRSPKRKDLKTQCIIVV